MCTSIGSGLNEPPTETDLRDQIFSLKQEVTKLKRDLANSKRTNIQAQLDVLEDSEIYPAMKAGCIGEFAVTTQQVCPECWNRDEEDRDEICEFCGNKSDEYCLIDVEVVVPWSTQKEIFKMMCKYKALAIKQGEK